MNQLDFRPTPAYFQLDQFYAKIHVYSKAIRLIEEQLYQFELTEEKFNVE